MGGPAGSVGRSFNGVEISLDFLFKPAIVLSERKNSMKNYELVTIKLGRNFESKSLGNPSFRIKATQEYLPDAGIGHYKYVVEDENGNILKATYSCGAAHTGKIDKEFLEHELERFWAEYEQYQRYLKNEKN